VFKSPVVYSWGQLAAFGAFQFSANLYLVIQVKMRKTGTVPPLHYTSSFVLNCAQDIFIFIFIPSEYWSVHRLPDGRLFLNILRENIAVVY
jgi:hypothetical protein